MHTSVQSVHLVLMILMGFQQLKLCTALSLKVISILALCKGKFMKVNALVLVVCMIALAEVASQILLSLF